ncbi:hypothetical protein OKW26_003632 [Paraburkholderia sp. 32]
MGETWAKSRFRRGKAIWANDSDMMRIAYIASE